MKLNKYFAAITTLSMVLNVVPALAQTATTSSVTTGLTRDTSGGANPFVKAKWEAHPDRYTDDDVDAGAQLLPSGQYNVHTTVAFCSVITDPDGLADIKNVYADFFYPNVALGTSHTALSDQSGLGCEELMQEDSLTRLSKADGIDLFCNLVRNNNNNLPTFGPIGGTGTVFYDYDEICAPDGELQKETAAVYCGEKDISYEDPDGVYEVWSIPQDQVGLQGKLVNNFTYLPVTAFEADFNSVAYGNVRLNTHKIISGDLTWNNPVNTGRASVRNVGNTRLSMWVMQDDMGFGKTDGQWNVEYDARVGSNATFAVYSPLQTVKLTDSLDLSELDEVDFSISVFKFPPTHTGDSYIGTMTLSATPEEHLECEPE